MVSETRVCSHRRSVKGVPPKVNDRVLVEASYNANMPFKWNATRIQVLPTQVSRSKKKNVARAAVVKNTGFQEEKRNL